MLPYVQPLLAVADRNVGESERVWDIFDDRQGDPEIGDVRYIGALEETLCYWNALEGETYPKKATISQFRRQAWS